uniref:Uncharacterized protein n=1 Tax=Daphnia galeata TaxID=27404 RepID=A0A8J2RPW0_9CRUS|nr:unnamed protein product [Daphnia galeata]
MESTEEGERKANFMANKWAEQNVPDMAIIMSDSRPDLEKISSITVSQKSTAARCGKTIRSNDEADRAEEITAGFPAICGPSDDTQKDRLDEHAKKMWQRPDPGGARSLSETGAHSRFSLSASASALNFKKCELELDHRPTEHFARTLTPSIRQK